ncbi:unnamed protein product [Brachionus calyciflorus]|uniref:Large ribosomal subunit protein mL62 n=1 Tax=Brachionus calyciflorus TaxID=104777 RepID=A0A813RR28_9BILA|nr:unnamed protein product [Brachionus calyciflorus]
MFSLATKLSFFKNSLINRSVTTIVQNGYKSSISLDKLYPKSNHDILAKPNLNLESNENFTGFIPIDKLIITQKTSSKPGGQHVNKTQTGVEIRFHVDSSEWIPKWIRDKLKQIQINRINKEGYLIVRSEKTRKALLNQADCMEQIRSMIHQASYKPKGLSADEKLKIDIDKKIADGRRLVDKRTRSEKKSNRKHPIYDSISDYYN